MTRYFSGREQLCLILVALYGSSLCESSGLGLRASIVRSSSTGTIRSSSTSIIRSSSTTTTSSSSTGTIRSSSTSIIRSSSTITTSSSSTSTIPSSSTSTIPSSSTSAIPSSSTSNHIPPIVNAALSISTTTLPSSSATANYTSTITSAPVYPWGDQIIPDNTCSVTATGTEAGEIQWTPCEIFAGTLQMSYFPESSGNLSYPSTIWDPNFGVTMTSPSIYMMVNTVTGDNSCGPLGPTYQSLIISMDLSEVFTLQPYADHTVTTRMGPPQELTLSDLTSDCLNTYGTFSTDGAFINTHPVYGNYNRCRPRFVFPIELKRAGYPYWKHCGNDNYTYGIFDPPGAVPPVVGLLPTTAAAPVISSYQPASPSPTTTLPPVSAVPPALPETTQSPLDPPTPSIALPTTAIAIPTMESQTIGAIPGSPGDVLPNDSTVLPIAIATVASKVISAALGATNIVVGSQTASLGGQAITVSGAVIQLTPSGVLVNDGSNGGTLSIFAVPTSAGAQDVASSTAIATVGAQVISAAPGDSSLVIGSQIITAGGSPVTIDGSNDVATLGPSGLVIYHPGGAVSSYALPTAPKNVVTATPIATIGGQVISAKPGGSKVTINGQIITAGGSPVTLAGSNNVASLGPNGLIVQYPGGSVSSYALPTALILGEVPVFTEASIPSVISLDASVISIGNQVVTLGGEPITIGNDVVSLGPSGLEIQMPGGSVTTISAHTEASTVVGVLSTSSKNGIAPIIASIAGATQTSIGSAIASSSSESSPSALVTASGGRRNAIWSGGVWIWVAFGVWDWFGV